MGLNKNGWSMKEMIIFSSILFAFLLVAIFYIMRLYNGLEEKGAVHNNSSSNQETVTLTYSDIEDRVLEAGLDYYNEYYDDTLDIKITTDKMIRHSYLYSKEIRPSNENKACKGYVMFENGEPSVYIKCLNYQTPGYEE